jgi:hypothetical protein
MAKIGAGQQGVVFLASTDREGKHKIIIKVSPTNKAYSPAKQPARVEYDIQKALYKIAPRHIPKPIKFFEQTSFIPARSFENQQNHFDPYKQSVMYTEYAHGGDLKSWLRKMGDRITDDAMADIIRQVIGTLKKIHAKYPEFRHNDLHLGNILVDDTKKKPRMMLTDFGLSRLEKYGSNPAVNSGNYSREGITNSTSPKYDAHYFLNAVDSEIKTGLPRTKAFLGRMLTGEYRGYRTSLVRSFRLRSSASNEGFPSFTEILRDPFLSGKTSPKVCAKPVLSPSVGAVFNTATPITNAADIARLALANMPGVTINRPSASNFLRMSPRSRAALFTQRRGRDTTRSVVVRNVTRTRGANVVRETLRRVPNLTAIRRLPLGTGSRVTVPVRHAVPYTPSPPRVPRESPPRGPRFVPIPAPTPQERTRLARAARGVRRTRQTQRAGGSRQPQNSPKKILNAYVNAMNNLRPLTRRMLKTKLVNSGFTVADADRYARNWETNWIPTRASVNHAVGNLKKGKNITKLLYKENVLPVARRRHAENLTKGSNGRVRKGNVLLSGKKKPELVAIARRHGILGANSMTKDMIIAALYG